MLIPSIDLMDGKIVQLVQGDRKALEFDDFAEWVNRFHEFPMVQLIDLDAAMGRGNNAGLIEHFAAVLPCQVGGGMRTLQDARRVFAAGAKKVIIGSALYSDAGVNLENAAAFARAFAAPRLIFSADSRAGKIAIHGWKTLLDISPERAIKELEPYCGGFLYTHIDTEGLMQGFPLRKAEQLRAETQRKLIVAGGIRTRQEVEKLDAIGVDAVVGMAIYTGAISIGIATDR